MTTAEVANAAYAEFYEKHAELEQALVARAFDELNTDQQDAMIEEAQRHHEACRLLVRAMSESVVR